jgi:hypothetical protein
MKKIPPALLCHLQEIRASDTRLEAVMNECEGMMETLLGNVTNIRNTITMNRIPIHDLIPFDEKSDMDTFFKVS